MSSVIIPGAIITGVLAIVFGVVMLGVFYPGYAAAHYPPILLNMFSTTGWLLVIIGLILSGVGVAAAIMAERDKE